MYKWVKFCKYVLDCCYGVFALWKFSYSNWKSRESETFPGFLDLFFLEPSPFLDLPAATPGWWGIQP